MYIYLYYMYSIYIKIKKYLNIKFLLYNKIELYVQILKLTDI